MSTPVTIGVLGGRSWIFDLAVGPAMRSCDAVRLGSVGSRVGPLGYDDVLADPGNDAVYIALPNGMHLEWVERAAAAGKHVLCEKPLGCTPDEVRSMAAACDAAGVVLAEAYMSPFHPRSAEISRRLGSGDLGELRHSESAFTFRNSDPTNYRWSPEQGGGALLDVGIYCLSPLLLAAGEAPSQVRASVMRAASGVDATTSAQLRWRNGATASVVTSFELPERQWLHIAGTEGSLTVARRPFTPGPDDGEFRIARPDGTVERHDVGGANIYVGMLQAFAAAVRGDEAWPRPISEVVAVATVIEQIVRAGLEP
ncbi:MAG: hypothetical protein RI958_3067 [Actinomycetota bacterium]|jgi:xylose dehydrogenase (NAD/NADP)